MVNFEIFEDSISIEELLVTKSIKKASENAKQIYHSIEADFLSYDGVTCKFGNTTCSFRYKKFLLAKLSIFNDGIKIRFKTDVNQKKNREKIKFEDNSIQLVIKKRSELDEVYEFIRDTAQKAGVAL